MPSEFKLDVVGFLEGTDKSSFYSSSWDYLCKYETVFAPLRDQPINLIEIGVERGPSLKVWKYFFSAATIVGIDIHPGCAELADDRIRIEIGSQDDPSFLARVCASYPPSIIIDDGSHRGNHVIYTFERMFPSLLPGGYYVVEDLYFHFGPQAKDWQGPGGFSPSDYFLNLVKQRLSRTIDGDGNWGTSKYLFDTIHTITAIDSALILRKKPVAADVRDVMKFAEDYTRSHPLRGDAYDRLAGYILKNWGPVEQAETAARKAIALDPGNRTFIRKLFEVLSASGRLAEARVVAQRGVESSGVHSEEWALLALAETRMGDFGAAEAAYLKAIALDKSVAFHHRDLSLLLERQGRIAEALTHAQQACALAEGKNYQKEMENLVAHLRAR
jgi:tetratricopeptide (TPR) repeat protein